MEQLQDVSNILWRERNLLELLAFKLDSERLLARAGRTRWLARADHEVEMVIDELKAVELERGIHVQALGEQLGLAGDSTLLLLADAVPGEWAGILADHRRALLELAATSTAPRVVADAHRRRRSRSRAAGRRTTAVPSRCRRALADIVQPPRADAPATGRRATRSVSTRQRATARPEAVVARVSRRSSIFLR